MRHASFTTVALATVLLVVASSCSATETVTVLESASPASSSVSQDEPAASSSEQVEATADIEPDDDDLIELAPEDSSDDDSSDDGSGDDTETSDDDGNKASTARSGEATCTYLGVDSFDDMQIELRLTSELDVQADVSVIYTVWDGDRSVLVESTHSMEDLAPGESVRMSVDTVTNPPENDDEVSCTIGELTTIDSESDNPFRPAPGDSCRFVEVDFANDVQIEIMLANPIDELTELVVDYAVRSSNGIRFSDGVTYSDEIEAGASATLEIDTFDELPSWVDIDDVECSILAIERF